MTTTTITSAHVGHGCGLIDRWLDGDQPTRQRMIGAYIRWAQNYDNRRKYGRQWILFRNGYFVGRRGEASL